MRISHRAGVCRLAGLLLLFVCLSSAGVSAQTLIPKFALPKSGLELARRAQAGTFYDVVGRRAAVFGYEHRALEVWAYPMKLVDDFDLSFKIEGYPLEFAGRDILTHIEVRPEATILTYSHAAFTVRQIIYAPVDEPGVIMLLDVNSTLPMTVTALFRPKLKLFWPAGLQTGFLDWQEKPRVYYIGEETQKFTGVVGSPAGRDASVTPYQEEPRDVPARLVIEASPMQFKNNYIPLVITGGVNGRADAKASYDRMLANAPALYEKNVAYYRKLNNDTLTIKTPDERLNTAFAWAKVGMDKGVATNPTLGTGLVAGFRTSGDSERPGYAWFFGRDSMWTALALNAEGDYATTRTALEFLKKFQREDGKIPHEISQSAAFVNWFKDYPYPWASTDATPLYVLVHADYWQATGDKSFLQSNWESILKAYRFSEASDTDGNGLLENTKFGHGWVEGGALYPPHEEVYLQGLWVAASRQLAELATAMGDQVQAARARQNAERTRAAMEQTYWLQERGFYAYATKLPAAEPPKADPGPNRETRQARLNELGPAKMFDEDTVLPAVPLWWHTMQEDRAQSQIDHLGRAAIATDWGARIIANDSRLYDPLSYHYGSVWPLFTGWQSMGAYRYGRPHVGYQALMATALLTYSSSLGYVTELLSGDFNAPFGRSSHHQVWSEAMVVSPAVHGLLGLETTGGGTIVRFAPQLPAHWANVEARNYAAGRARYDFALSRNNGVLAVKIQRRETADSNFGTPTQLIVAPAFPLNAKIKGVTAAGRALKFDVKKMGDVQFVSVNLDAAQPATEVIYTYEEGTDAGYDPESLTAGATNQGLRVIRSQADGDSLKLLLEGVSGHTYVLPLRIGTRTVANVNGATLTADNANALQLSVTFDGPPESYTRREIALTFKR